MALSQSRASEQSARLRTLSGAEEEMKKLVEEATLAYHLARQERITQDLLELTPPARRRKRSP
jgi:F0F1-type ATP synthase gamma subunit